MNRFRYSRNPRTISANAVLLSSPRVACTQDSHSYRHSSATITLLGFGNVRQDRCPERTRTRKGVKSVEPADAITSLNPSDAVPERLLKLWRGHSRIENQVHCVRDVTFEEDRCQVRTGTSPQVSAALRNLVIGLVRRVRATKMAAALGDLSSLDTPRSASSLTIKNHERGGASGGCTLEVLIESLSLHRVRTIILPIRDATRAIKSEPCTQARRESQCNGS